MTTKIACITGSRADYGYLRPVMKKIREDKGFELVPIATGMHLIEKYGYTFNEVKKDFPNCIGIKLNLQEDNGYGTSLYISEGIEKISKVLKEINLDMLLVLGDRTEMFAAVQAAACMNIPIVHMAGGDVCEGCIDNSIRHATSKFAHVHLAGTEKHAERLRKMGEEDWRIYTVGYSSLDEILNMKLPEKKKLLQKYGLNPEKPYVLVVQHPATLQSPSEAAKQIEITLESVLEKGIQAFLIYPNNDAGGQAMINVIKKYENKIKTKASVPREDYLGLLKYTSLMIGNSSSGILEAPSFNIPVVNIGIRQRGRERAGNVIDVDDFDKTKILNAIDYTLNHKNYSKKIKSCKNPYGDGKTSEKVLAVLKNIEINEKLLQKKVNC